jgi:hypothetical protein
MTHASQEQLMLHYYGECKGREWIDAHLAGCAECRREYRSLQVTLNLMDSAPVPERGEGYGEQVWEQVRRRLPHGARRRETSLFWRFAQATAIAGLMVCAYVAGRLTPASPEARPAAVSAAEARRRVLEAELSDHLERARIVLIELANAAPADSGDAAYEQEIAGDLVAANRLLRAVAGGAGETTAAALLEDLERVLLEAARPPSRLNGPRAAEMLFKIRVFDEGMRQPERETL